MMQAILDKLIRDFVVLGRLTVHWPDGSTTAYGGAPGPDAAVRVNDKRTVRRMVLDPALALGETYMDHGVEVVDGTIYDLLDVLMTNIATSGSRQPILKARVTANKLLRRFAQFNPAGRARRNVTRHYDLNGRTYALFLDRDRQYSCAYFERGDETLEVAQLAKKRHIAAKLNLNRRNLTVLDIGCGWGGMAMTLAREFGARVTGITLSTEQLAEARARAEAEGLSDRVSFQLADYRTLSARYDRIVSVGMFEHVGIVHYDDFFRTLERCLAPDGVALVHAIGRAHGPAATTPWLTKYIFPGGYSPALSEVFPAVERAGLWVTDVEILRLHYAETLRHWRRRFAANRRAIAAMHDERFCRMFEFYLAGSELAFRRQGHMVWQLQVTRDQAALPLVRDYIQQAEQRAWSREHAIAADD